MVKEFESIDMPKFHKDREVKTVAALRIKEKLMEFYAMLMRSPRVAADKYPLDDPASTQMDLLIKFDANYPQAKSVISKLETRDAGEQLLYELFSRHENELQKAYSIYKAIREAQPELVNVEQIKSEIREIIFHPDIATLVNKLRAMIQHLHTGDCPGFHLSQLNEFVEFKRKEVLKPDQHDVKDLGRLLFHFVPNRSILAQQITTILPLVAESNLKTIKTRLEEIIKFYPTERWLPLEFCGDELCAACGENKKIDKTIQTSYAEYKYRPDAYTKDGSIWVTDMNENGECNVSFKGDIESLKTQMADVGVGDVEFKSYGKPRDGTSYSARIIDNKKFYASMKTDEEYSLYLMTENLTDATNLSTHLSTLLKQFERAWDINPNSNFPTQAQKTAEPGVTGLEQLLKSLLPLTRPLSPKPLPPLIESPLIESPNKEIDVSDVTSSPKEAKPVPAKMASRADVPKNRMIRSLDSNVLSPNTWNETLGNINDKIVRPIQGETRLFYFTQEEMEYWKGKELNANILKEPANLLFRRDFQCKHVAAIEREYSLVATGTTKKCETFTPVYDDESDWWFVDIKLEGDDESMERLAYDSRGIMNEWCMDVNFGACWFDTLKDNPAAQIPPLEVRSTGTSTTDAYNAWIEKIDEIIVGKTLTSNKIYKVAYTPTELLPTGVNNAVLIVKNVDYAAMEKDGKLNNIAHTSECESVRLASIDLNSSNKEALKTRLKLTEDIDLVNQFFENSMWQKPISDVFEQERVRRLTQYKL